MLASERLAELGAMATSRAQVRVFSDDGFCVFDPLIMRRALEYVKSFDGVIAETSVHERTPPPPPRVTVGSAPGVLAGVVDGIRDGRIWEFDISSTLLTIFLVSVSLPALMAVLAMTLPARANRATNLVVASLLIPYSMFNAIGESWEWAAFYGLSIGTEVLLLAFILRSAWTWPRTTSPSMTEPAAPRRPQIQLGR